MDDLDGPRVERRFIDQAQGDLEWLGLDWDGPVQHQSQGLAQIQAALTQLVDSGLVYPCVCSRKEIRDAQSAPQQGQLEPRYPGTCRQRFPSLQAAAAIGKHVGLRFLAPDVPVRFSDGIAGNQSFNVQRDVGDFLVGRRDGTPAYQLAVVIDDTLAGVTEVVRGDDLLASTARQILLQRALGLGTPAFHHLPLVLDAAGRRLAKRHDALSLRQLRQASIDPRAIVGWVAASVGMTNSGRLNAAEGLEYFSMATLPRQPVRVPHDIRELLAQLG